jgi:tetratricopeptide (TPR) repeat protein
MKSLSLFLICFFILFSPRTTKAQKAENIFSDENSIKYAEHLVITKQLDLAGFEYKRLAFAHPDNLLFKDKLINIYLINKQYDKAVQQFDQWENDNLHLSEKLLFKYGRILMISQNPNYTDFMKKKPLSDSLECILTIEESLLNLDFKKAEKFVAECKNDHYKNILAKTGGIKKKSPLLAGSMSLIIPGSGKVYTGFWKDGLTSLIMVGVFSWQSYKGFSAKGPGSTYGWIYGSLGFGFHLGNVYGSFKSAKKRNSFQQKKYVEIIEDNIVLFD